MTGVKFPQRQCADGAVHEGADQGDGAATRATSCGGCVAGVVGDRNLYGGVFGLSAWAQELQQKAQDAYDSAFNAQGSANYANAWLILLFGDGLASDSGGTAVSALFNGAAATTLSGFTRTGVGPGREFRAVRVGCGEVVSQWRECPHAGGPPQHTIDHGLPVGSADFSDTPTDP